MPPMLQENEALIMILKMELFSSFLSHQPEHILFFFFRGGQGWTDNNAIASCGIDAGKT